MKDPAARRLLRESRAARVVLVATAVLGVLQTAALLAQAVLLADVLARGFLDHATLHALATPLIALALVTAARAGLSGLIELAGRLGAQRAMSQLRMRLAARLLHGDGARERSGDLAIAAVQGVDALETWFARSLPSAVLATLVPIAVIAFVVPRDLTAALVLAATVPVLIGFMILVGLAARTRARSRWQALTLLGAHFSDVVRGLATLRAHVREQAQIDTMDGVADAYRRETMGTLRVAFLSALVLELVAMLGTALAAATVGLQLVAGHVGLRAGLTVLILAPELYAPLRAVGQQFHASTEGLAAAERIFAELDRPLAVAAVTHPRVAPDPAVVAITADRVCFSYPDRDRPALDGVCLRIVPGEVVALCGPSGAGKSTLAALLLGLRAPDSGVLACGGVNLRDVDVAAWRRRIAWVPQSPTLFAGTIEENVALGAPGHSAAQIAAAIAGAGAAGFVASLPAGVSTRIGDGGRTLSAGQAQRLAIARALLRDAALVILDEPTAHLDAVTATQVAGSMLDALRGRSVLLITHRAELAALADRVVELCDGRAVAPSAAARTMVAA